MKRFFCISALFLCAACANDLGNYDYRDLTEPDITGIEANISVLTHARLQLTPDLGGNDFPDDRYSFEWRTLARSADETVTVIGHVAQSGLRGGASGRAPIRSSSR